MKTLSKDDISRGLREIKRKYNMKLMINKMNVISAVEKLKQANNQLTEMERRVREANDDTTRDAARHARASAIDAYDAAYDAYTAACSGREVVKYAD